MKKIIVFILLMCCQPNLWSQDSGNVTAADTVAPPAVRKPAPRRQPVVKTDSFRIKDSLKRIDSSLLFAKDHRPSVSLFQLKMDTPIYAHHPYYRFTHPMRYSVTVKKWKGREALFYSIIALLIFFALIKNGFYRYLQDIVRTYFQTNLKQKQVREQLLQNPLPSLLLNLFFALSAGMFLALLFQYFKLGMEFNFWLLYLYCILGLISVYAVKFIFLKFFGWVFQLTETTDAYIFIVFTTNKIIGLAILPLLVLLALTYGAVNKAAMNLSIIVVLALIAYRFIISYMLVRKQIRISFFHFLLYLCAFELIPLLLINKLLFRLLAERP